MQAQKSVRLPFKAAHGAPRSVVLRAPRHQTSSTRGATLVARAAEYRMPMWEYVQQKLVSEKIESVSPQRAAEMAASGQWTIVDVRPAAEFQAAHIPGAASCPLYQPLDMSAADFGKMLKFVALKANGVNPVEPNPKFKETMAAIAASDKGLVVVCETGGTLQPSTSFANGKASRSLQAIYRTISEGVVTDSSRLVHLTGGVFGWYKAQMPFDGIYDPSNAGKTPNVV